MKKEKPRQHAVLSPSGAHRWLVCTPSARLEEQFPDSTSDAAAEGTLAHALCEAQLKYSTGLSNSIELKEEKNRIAENDFYCGEMQEHANEFETFVLEKYNAAGKGAYIFLEKQLNLTEYVPEGFGTGDVIIIANGVLEIIDLKYGKGVPVSCENNKQMMLYAVGALTEFDYLYEIKDVRMTIYQPRIDNISTFTMPARELMAWAETELKTKAKEAFDGAGDFVPGDHCRFCRARATCRALAEHNMKVAEYEFKKPPLLDNSEVADLLSKAADVIKWLDDVSEYALDQAVNHDTHYPGFKVVEGRSNRKYNDEPAIVGALSEAGYEKDKLYKIPALIGITDMEKLIGKKTFAELLNPYVIKPQGKPALVPESDKRPAMDSSKAAIQDFINESE